LVSSSAPPRLRPRRLNGARLLIFLDETAFPCSFQRAAHSRRGFHRCKGPNRGAIIGPLGTEIGAAHDRFATAKLVGEFGLETSKHRLGFSRAAFGGHCDRVAPASLRSGCRTRGQTGARRRRPRRTVIRNERQRPPDRKRRGGSLSCFGCPCRCIRSELISVWRGRR